MILTKKSQNLVVDFVVVVEVVVVVVDVVDVVEVGIVVGTFTGGHNPLHGSFKFIQP